MVDYSRFAKESSKSVTLRQDLRELQILKSEHVNLINGAEQGQANVEAGGFAFKEVTGAVVGGVAVIIGFWRGDGGEAGAEEHGVFAEFVGDFVHAFKDLGKFFGFGRGAEQIHLAVCFRFKPH